MGPNVKKLVIRYMSTKAVPKGGGLGDVLNFLTTPGKMVEVARESQAWVLEAIRQVREAGPNLQWLDEDIAAEILKRIEEREGKG